MTGVPHFGTGTPYAPVCSAAGGPAVRWRLAGLLAAVSVAAAADGAGLVWDAERGAKIAVPEEADLA